MVLVARGGPSAVTAAALAEATAVTSAALERDAIEAAGDEGAGAMRAFVRRTLGRTSERAMETARFALIDVPYGAVRRHLVAGRAPPPLVDELVEETARALLRLT